MVTEQEIRDFLSKLRYEQTPGRAVAYDSEGARLASLEMTVDNEDNLPDKTMLCLLKDEIIHAKYLEYWTSLFVQGKSTYDIF